jgi:preprotein translocase subunit SecA
MDISSLYTRARSAHSLAAAHKTVAAIGRLEAQVQQLGDAELAHRFQALAARPLKERVVEGFALVREASRRVLGLRQFDVQLIGGLTLMAGRLAEMRTGEGKTLTIAAPAAVMALDGKGVHVVTANAYLAERDAQLMRPLYEALGLSVGFVHDDQGADDKRAAYAATITYGVGHQFGFDYLRDNLARERAEQVQRGLYAAIVDEVDSILIDEARVPLIISARAADVSEAVRAIDRAVAALQPGVHLEANLKEKQVTLTEAGYQFVEQSLTDSGLLESPAAMYEARNLALVRRVHSAAKAYGLFRRDRDYVIENGELVLVDQGTGRKIPGRRFEDGLHEALEAKEGVRIQPGSMTRATITYQNFFGLYSVLAGLTGTAATEAEEFAEIYNLETVVIPTNRPVQRRTLHDVVYLTKSEKFTAAAQEIAQRQVNGQPVLVGCATIRDAEVMGRLLAERGIAHEVLTAKNLAREADIIAQAGRLRAVTVATNMAGRGTDILLGGEKPARSAFDDDASFDAAMSAWKQERDAVLAAGGLFVLGTERNGLRRVDNQLAGRSGRQGDPGEVQFLLSLEDELLRVFGKDGRLALVRRMVQASGSALSGKHVVAMVTAAQKKFEGQGFDARRTLMKYDSVLADQRRAVYALREHLLDGGAVEHCRGVIAAAIDAWAQRNLDGSLLPEQWDLGAAKKDLIAQFGLSLPLLGWVHKDELERDAIVERIAEAAAAHFDAQNFDEAACRAAVFDVLSDMWTEHLTALDELRQAVGLKQHTGLNPVYQYGREAFELFQAFEQGMCVEITSRLLNTARQAEVSAREAADAARHAGDAKVAIEAEMRWIRRNDACPCGSGKRFRECHGQLA